MIYQASKYISRSAAIVFTDACARKQRQSTLTGKPDHDSPIVPPVSV